MMALFQLVGGGKGVAVIMLLVAVAGFIGYQKIQIMGLEHDVRTLELTVQERDLEIVRLNGEVSQCRAKMDITNDRIADLKTTRDMQKQNFDMLAENIEAFKEVNGLKIKELVEADAPETCELIMTYLRKGVGTE